ncbi:MAG: ABC transporter permease [Halobacteriota archaeon]
MNRDALFDVWHLYVRALKKTIRTPILIFSTLALPVLFLVLFTQIFTQFGNLPGFPAGGYVQYAVAGIIVMNPLFGSGGAGNAVVDDINSGFLSKMLVTPANRAAILFGRLLHDMTIVIIPVSITLVLAYALGATVMTGAPGILLILFTAAFFGLAMSGLTMAIGVTTKSSQAVEGLDLVVTFPLAFVSTAFVPYEFLPGWAQAFSNVNPFSYAVNAVRVLMSTGFVWSTILAAYAVTAVFAAVTIGATLYQFRSVVK